MTRQQEIAATLKAWFLENDGTWSLAIDQGSYLTLDGSFDPSEIVRVVLSAAREPTGEMISAACRAPGEGVIDHLANAWRAMIDEMLNT